ncbi:hypothetical protein ABIF64_008733 [Bradyrhizobium japonicum]|nr:hypothetical protein [Bradyrhizobium japonicum]MCP1785568.1 hypothetical protein [Bradyrhizobium japonicum]MCP1807447.1 hypothetical protein [Bradyrhizobium japonicum]MCP1816374.1 hypothetical protein [Bradyrhizobium japonicum]MCP1872113.1 hypothetical protein [Bradyrhizobium japonicum]
MCRFAGEALQFYKNPGRRDQVRSNKRAHGSAIGCGVLHDVWRREIFHYGHILCRHTRRSWRGPCSRGSTAVSKAGAYLNSDRMLWLFWLAIESA